MKKRSAITLLETLLAMAIIALFMTASIALIGQLDILIEQKEAGFDEALAEVERQLYLTDDGNRQGTIKNGWTWRRECQHLPENQCYSVSVYLKRDERQWAFHTIQRGVEDGQT